MASLIRRSTDTREIRLIIDGRTVTIRLGRMPVKDCEKVMTHIERLAIAKATNTSPATETGQWLSGLEQSFHGRLSRAGLIGTRHTPASIKLGELIARVRALSESQSKPATIVAYEQCWRLLVRCFGASTDIRKIDLAEPRVSG